MNTRPLNEQESKNLAALNRAGCNSVLLFLTETGLRKSILDATEPMRRLLCAAGVHDFSNQSQGQASKVKRPALVLADTEIEPVTASLYRPTTKNGDPRLWFSMFNRRASPDDVCAVFVRDNIIHVLNLTRSRIAELLDGQVVNHVTELFRKIGEANSLAAQELLVMLRKLAVAGPIKAECTGSTAIGRSIESALGIKMNSSSNPDYKGIEIKSGRSSVFSGRQNKATLFGCVADWDLSRCKSSREILERFGYERENDFKLYCTVSTRRANSQGLQLEVKEAERWLREFCAREPVEEVCIWRLEKLHQSLVTKHNETFWVSADVTWKENVEWFQLKSVIHTSRPSVNQFDRLLTDGTVTLDHLIKRGESDKGPLFKVQRPRLGELFLGEPRKYSLVS